MNTSYDITSPEYEILKSQTADRVRLASHFITHGTTVSARMNGLEFLTAAGEYSQFLSFEEKCEIIDSIVF